MSTWLFSHSLLSASTASRVVLDFILVLSSIYFNVVINCSLTIAIDDNTLVFCFGEYKVGCCSSHCKYFSLKHSRIVAEMNGFFGNVIMAVVDKHTCSSPVVIKLGACICVAVEVVVDRFDFFVIFLCWDVHSKVRGKGRGYK